MSRKPAKPEVAAAIKWTEEEWGAIAARLLDVHGAPLLSSATLDEIKAKDVFSAQEVLARNRQRKLISISQGFAASRQRLHALIQQRKRGLNNDRTGLIPKGKQLSKQVVPTVGDSGSRQKNTVSQEPHVRPSDKGGSTRSVRQAGVTDKANAPISEQRITGASPAAAAVPIDAGPTASATTEVPGMEKHGDHPLPAEQAAKGPGSIALPATMQAHPSDASRGGDARARESTSHGSRQKQPGQRSDRLSAPIATGVHTVPAAAQPPTNLVELARPFVAMVCQELAAALVTALSSHGGGQNLADALQAMLPGTTERHPTARDDADASSPPHVKLTSHQHNAMLPEDDMEHAGEADVQPLFDPKLPPSPNSVVKPRIGLIGAGSRDLEEFRQFYPQLQLTVVSPDAVRNTPDLGDCQRMLGLREDISTETDEYLRRAFGNRYLRISGGAERIREQLRAWLDNPGSINSPGLPRKQFKGKGKGVGMPKKRHNRPPGTAR